MENSVNEEKEKLLSSRLADWPGCLEGKERDGRAKVMRRDKDRKMHTALHICLELLRLKVSSAVGAINYLFNIPHVKSETHHPHPQPSNAHGRSSRLNAWHACDEFLPPFLFRKQKGAEMSFQQKAAPVRHIFHCHQQ